MRRGASRGAASIAAVAIVLGVAGEGRAATKDECIDAHSRGQDLRERGQLVRARQTFMVCAQSSCPSLVQGDCARFGEELSQIVPTVTFSARDASANDLPTTSVYVDGSLFATRLDDGKSYEVDPGKHVVRYVHDGKETTISVVVNQGEKGRLLLATFVDEGPKDVPYPAEAPPAPKRSALPLVVAGLGTAAAVTGGTLFALGMGKVPSTCNVSSHECSGPPGDPSLDKAQSGMSLANLGIGIGVTGAVMLVGGLVWYFVQPRGSVDARRASLPTPTFTF